MHEGDCGTAGVGENFAVPQFLLLGFLLLTWCQHFLELFAQLLGAADVHQCGDGNALDYKDSKESRR